MGRLHIDMAFELQEGPIVNFSGCRASNFLDEMGQRMAGQGNLILELEIVGL